MNNLSQIISHSKSFMVGTEGRDVIIFRAESDLEKTLKIFGFEQHDYTDPQSGHRIATDQWFNAKTLENVFIGKDQKWTYAVGGNVLCLEDGEGVLK